MLLYDKPRLCACSEWILRFLHPGHCRIAVIRYLFCLWKPELIIALVNGFRKILITVFHLRIQIFCHHQSRRCHPSVDKGFIMGVILSTQNFNWALQYNTTRSLTTLQNQVSCILIIIKQQMKGIESWYEIIVQQVMDFWHLDAVDRNWNIVGKSECELWYAVAEI